MNVIVPIAGPDYFSNGKAKGLRLNNGEPILWQTLTSRPWHNDDTRYIFVILDGELAREFAELYLRKWFINSSFVFLSEATKGAALSSLSAISIIKDFNSPLIVDLGDIGFYTKLNIENLFLNNKECGGIALSFYSSNPIYSYFYCQDNSDFVQQAIEKKVISNHASAGTYIFRNSRVFLKAVSHSLEFPHLNTHDNLFYVCPLFNGVIAAGYSVQRVEIESIIDFKYI